MIECIDEYNFPLNNFVVYAGGHVLPAGSDCLQNVFLIFECQLFLPFDVNYVHFQEGFLI